LFASAQTGRAIGLLCKVMKPPPDIDFFGAGELVQNFNRKEILP
jgi:hypothetical protein